MQTVSPVLIHNKKVLLRLDIDVPLEQGTGDRLQVTDDFRLVKGMPTLELCLKHAKKVIIMGHIGRPEGHDPELTVAPIYDWLEEHGFDDELESEKLKLLENLRFEKGEEEASIYFAKELASLGDFYINDAFASHHKSASTTVLPMLLPHCAGLQFAKEVETLTKVRDNPKKPLVVIIGGVKVEDKLPVALSLAKIADQVLVGGKIAGELSNVDRGAPAPATPDNSDFADLPVNLLLADLIATGEDITPETTAKWAEIIKEAKMIVWNGPLGLVEDPINDQTEKIAEAIINSGAETIIGGGDTVSYLDKLDLLYKFSFVSTGGGAMLKFLETGTLPTIQALS
jgi:3-phosphoglycerate kinase